jgi:hypothetical protein
MALLAFAEFAPDQPDLTAYTDIALNVIARTATSYSPMSGLSPYSSNALDGPCIGMLAAQNFDESIYLFAGTTDKLYIIGASLSFGFVDDGGVLTLTVGAGYPTDSSGPAGSLWSNGGVVSVVGPTTPDQAAPPVIFGNISPAELLALGGGNLPKTAPTAGSLQFWNSGGEVWIA